LVRALLLLALQRLLWLLVRLVVVT